ncbi:MAG: FkbM family methyltransferase [Chlamydiota bacterium]
MLKSAYSYAWIPLTLVHLHFSTAACIATPNGPVSANENHFQERLSYNLVSEEENIFISKQTEQIGATWWSGNVWDKPLIEKCHAILKGLDENFVFLDVGAQTGSFSLMAKYFPNSQWYAFEPIKEAADELIVNLALNGIQNAFVCNASVSDKSGWGTLKLPTDNHWGLATMGNTPLRFHRHEERKVECITLDEFTQTHAIQRVDFIKIDTEGWELFILKGGKDVIARNKPIILMEFNGTNMRQCGVSETEVCVLLEEMGYQWELVSTEDILCKPAQRKPS